MFQTLLIALGLSMDAFAVSVSSGICTDQLKPRHILRGSFFFGMFQFAMPILGWLLGMNFRAVIQNFDHWIAFILLAFIGGKMVKESFEAEPVACEDNGESERISKTDVRDTRTLLTLSVATSIDALGLVFPIACSGNPYFHQRQSLGP
ncbi:MAG TPA: manganese efflux pump [Treponema sp.]|nr:manganese efflux pump [Treponema sp.]HPC70827.1 manganese efflux pump [Treponema sp.]HRU28108.1 manganese efflux pump [Treponema sp.]